MPSVDTQCHTDTWRFQMLSGEIMRPSGEAWTYIIDWTMTSTNLLHDVTSNSGHHFDITAHSMSHYIV